MTSGGSRQAVILTAIPVEYEAVRAHLTDIRKEKHKQGTIYQQGKFIAEDQIWDVLIVETGVGNVYAAVEAERAINHFNPSIVLFVGVAGGLKDVKLGDVVVASQVYAYDFGKAEATYQTRPKVGIPAYLLEQLARAESREIDWLQRLGEPMPNRLPHVFVAPIAAGESVVASTRSSLYQFLRKNYSDAVAVEMEGHGFFHAVHANPRVDALIIRGISDLISNKKRRDAENWQMIAARHASAFAFEILAKLDDVGLQPGDPGSPGKQQNGRSNQPKTAKPEAKQTIASASAIESLLQEFRVALPGYRNKVERIRAFFDETADIFPHRYKLAIESLDSIHEHVQMLCKHDSELNHYDRARLFTIRDQIHALRLELQKSRLSFQHIKPSRQRREEERSREAISARCKALLSNLEDF